MKKTPTDPTPTAKNGKTPTPHKQRRKGEGGLEKHNGYYRGVYRFTDGTGQKHKVRCSFGTANRIKAEAMLKDWIKQFQGDTQIERLETLQRHIDVARAEQARREDEKPAMLLADAWRAYLESRERPDTGEATLTQYGFQFGRFVKWVEATHPTATEMRHIDKDIAGRFLADLGSKDKQGGIKLAEGNAVHGVLHGVGNGTYNKYITLFTLVWKVLKTEAKLTCNPWEGFTKKQVTQHSRRELTVEELARVLQVIGDDADLKLLFAVGIYTGLRLEDCIKLNWGEIDLVRGFINTTPCKIMRTGKQVFIPIAPTLAKLLAERESHKGYVFPDYVKTYGRRGQTIIKMIQTVFINAGIETTAEVEGNCHKATEVGFHSLRHSFVSICANNGVPLALVQLMVGHTNPAMTRHYLHGDETALKNAIRVMPLLNIGDITTETETDAGTWEKFVEAASRLTEAETERAIKWLTARLTPQPTETQE